MIPQTKKVGDKKTLAFLEYGCRRSGTKILEAGDCISLYEFIKLQFISWGFSTEFENKKIAGFYNA